MARNAQPDLSEFLEAQVPSGRKSLIEKIMSELTDDQRTRVMAALQSDEIGPDTIATVLGKWGHKISGSAIHYYRKANGWR
jgi:hypothetical protein